MNTRKVQDFVTKGREVYVGLEDSRKTWKIAVRCDRMLIHQTTMPAKYEILIQYLRNRFPECAIHLIYEAGFKGFTLFDRLMEDGIDCTVIPPHLVTEPKVNRVKTDKRDARRLALVLENHDFKEPCSVPDRERREDRQISRSLWALQKDIVCVRNRIRKLLDFHGVETSFPDRWGKKEIEAIKELTLGDSLKLCLVTLISQLEQLWAHRERLQEALKVLCSKERYKKAIAIAASLPGIGWSTAIRLVLELGEDLTRFTSGKKIAGFVGLGCSEYTTGETERKGHITGMGSGLLRMMLVESSWMAIRRDPVLLAKFTRIWKGRGSKKKAIVAVARMLIVRLGTCLVLNMPYAIGTIK